MFYVHSLLLPIAPGLPEQKQEKNLHSLINVPCQ